MKKAVAGAKEALAFAATSAVHVSLRTAGRSLGTSDAQLCCALWCVGAVASSAHRLEALVAARAMDPLPGCVREEDRARSVGPVRHVGTVVASAARVPCDRNARDMCQSEYTVSLIHHIRPLNSRETHGIRNFVTLDFARG